MAIVYQRTTFMNSILHLLYLTTLLIVLSFDTESNPGPYKPKYPCQICEKAVKWKQRALACDDCLKWYHVSCMNMSTPEYITFANPSMPWNCTNCGLPNFASSLFDSFMTLDVSDSGDPLTTSFTNLTANSPGPPMVSSSPKKTTTSHQSTINNLKVLVINFQSIKNKKEEFWVLMDQTNPCIVIGNETWLNPDISNSEIFPPGYNIYRKDRKDGHGGILIAIKSEYISELVDIGDDDCEIIFAKIALPSQKPLFIGSFYRPPTSDIDYANAACNHIETLANANKSSVFWVAGDFNLPDISWSANTVIGHQYKMDINLRFMEMISNIHSEQVVENVTRNDAILDLFITNRPSLINRQEMVPGLGDHDIIFVNSNIKATRQKPVPREIHLWRKANSQAMKLEATKFTSSFTEKYSSTGDIEEMWSDIKANLTSIVKDHVPSKTASVRFNQPWITTSIKRLSRQKKRSYQQARSSQKEKDWSRYKRLKKSTQRECRKAYNTFISDIISPDASTNPKKFWAFIKSKRCENNGVAPLRNTNGIIYSDDQTKAEILNNQFVSVFNKNEDDNIPDKGPSPFPSMRHIEVTEKGVAVLLNRLNVNKACGPDNISPRILKLLSAELAPALTHFFQASLDQGIVPSDWKSAHVVPLFKKGDKSKAANYRPVSLTSICCKLLEHIIHSSIMTHFDGHSILTDCQHGFRKRRSCESQLIKTVHDLAKGLDAGQQIDAILLDFSKAFDKVAHKRLLYKLEFYGVRDNISKWIRDFLANRQQKVILNGKFSSDATVASGVPQGSVLGPLLFLAFINDLPESVTSSSTRLFADDGLLQNVIKGTKDCRALQDDLNNLTKWESDWLMEFHPGKCQVIHVTNKTKPVHFIYSIHDQPLESTDSAKYLGLTIHRKLSWNDHINSTVKKADRTRAFLQRNLRSCPMNVKKQCYTTLVRPMLEYASVVWDPHCQTNIDKLEAVQRRAVRFIKNDYSRYSSVTTMLQELDIPTLEERRAKSKVTMMYRIANDLIDIPRDQLKPVRSATRKANSNNFLVPHSRLTSYQKSFYPDTIRLWNSLPANVVESPDLDTFKLKVQSVRLR